MNANQGLKMNANRILNRNFETMAWGALFIWWGLTELIPSLPKGVGLVGIGIILIGLNIARSMNGLPISGFSITIGILALIWGGLDMAGALLSLPFEIPIFAILLIVLGIIILAPELTGKRSS